MKRGFLTLVCVVACTRNRAPADTDAATSGSTVVAQPLTPSPFVPGTVPAFPGAEGFGARAVGGRGGAICRVTTLAKAGPGSLQECLDQTGRRTVVFDVSGVIEGPLEIKHGQLTIAGQTSAGGVTIKGGVVCDNVYDPNDCNDLIVRHVRFRGGAPDSFRIGGAHDVILDHCSFAGAEDENIEITRSRNITIQHSIIAEPRGEHYKWGGVLINYSKDVMPLDAITIHHSVWNGVSGRLPEMSCEENGDGPGKTNCSGRALSIELSNNVLWDVSDPIWFNRCTGTNEGNDCPPSAKNFGVKLNLVGNVMARRSSAEADLPFIEPAAFASPNSAIYASDNVQLRGAARVQPKTGIAARHPFPGVSYTPSASVVAEAVKLAGAFPRDKMDKRLIGYLGQSIDARPPAWKNENGVDVGDGFTIPATKAPGLPEGWKPPPSCAAGYTPLECYLNDLAVKRLASP
ncbi:MAG: hypothetical protein U0270_30480 [Labilithrix sp.]